MLRDNEGIDPTACIEPGCEVGRGTRIWGAACVMRGSQIGVDCTVGRHTHIEGSIIGDRCKIQTFAYLPPGVVLEEEVFVGPHACFTNHRCPTAVRAEKFQPDRTLVKRGAVIGANATIGPGVTIGEGAFIGMGAVVTSDVPAGATVYAGKGPCITPQSYAVTRHLNGPDGRGDDPLPDAA